MEGLSYQTFGEHCLHLLFFWVAYCQIQVLFWCWLSDYDVICGISPLIRSRPYCLSIFYLSLDRWPQIFTCRNSLWGRSLSYFRHLSTFIFPPPWATNTHRACYFNFFKKVLAEATLWPSWRQVLQDYPKRGAIQKVTALVEFAGPALSVPSPISFASTAARGWGKWQSTELEWWPPGNQSGWRCCCYHLLQWVGWISAPLQSQGLKGEKAQTWVQLWLLSSAFRNQQCPRKKTSALMP